MAQGYCGRLSGGRVGRHAGALPSATITLGSRHEDMEYGPDGEEGAVLGGLYRGDGPPSLQERLCPGHQEQLR